MIKKGCVFKIFFILVILAAVVFYLFDRYGTELYKTSKEIVTEKLISDLENKINEFSFDLPSDSLNIAVVDKLKKLKEIDFSIVDNKADSLLKDIKQFIDSNSSKIYESEELKRILENYEQREKNWY